MLRPGLDILEVAAVAPRRADDARRAVEAVARIDRLSAHALLGALDFLGADAVGEHWLDCRRESIFEIADGQVLLRRGVEAEGGGIERARAVERAAVERHSLVEDDRPLEPRPRTAAQHLDEDL